MIRISKLADYAVVVLAEMAVGNESLYSASTLALRVRLSEATVSKVLKLLSRADVVESVRGVNGGYRLINDEKDISIEVIITAVDGPIAIVACADDRVPDCSLSECCSVRGRWDDVNTAVRDALSSVTLADMIAQKNKLKEGVA